VVGYVVTGFLVILASMLVASTQPVVVERVPLLAILHHAMSYFFRHVWALGTAIIERVGR
jgi:hypothetical protein